MAVNVTLWLVQMLVEDAATLTAGATLLLTVMLMLFELTVVVPAQGLVEVNSQVTTAPLVNAVVLNEEELVPAAEPFTFHWYEGDEPALVTLALKVTVAPAQTVVLPVEMVIEAAESEFTVTAIAFEVTDTGEAQVAFEVITHETRSLLFSVDDEYVLLLVPTLFPFNFH